MMARGGMGNPNSARGEIGGRPGEGSVRKPTSKTPMGFPGGGGKTSIDQLMKMLTGGRGGSSGNMGGLFGGGK